MLVSSLISQGRVDEACAIAHEVLGQTRALGSVLVAKQLEDLGHLFAPFKRNPDIAAFIEFLQDELRERLLSPVGTDRSGTGAS